MDTNIFFIILLATIMHAIWNAMVKHHPDKAVAVSAIVLGHLPLCIFCIIYFPLPGKESIPFLIASVLTHQGYQWYLLNSYKVGDYTNVYPIFRGFGPLFATLISIVFPSPDLGAIAIPTSFFIISAEASPIKRLYLFLI